jgi:hypothetical protein
MNSTQAEILIRGIFTGRVITIMSQSPEYDLDGYKFSMDSIHPLIEFGVLFEKMSDKGVNGRVIWEYRLRDNKVLKPRITDMANNYDSEYWNVFVKYDRERKLGNILGFQSTR